MSTFLGSKKGIATVGNKVTLASWMTQSQGGKENQPALDRSLQLEMMQEQKHLRISQERAKEQEETDVLEGRQRNGNTGEETKSLDLKLEANSPGQISGFNAPFQIPRSARHLETRTSQRETQQKNSEPSDKGSHHLVNKHSEMTTGSLRTSRTTNVSRAAANHGYSTYNDDSKEQNEEEEEFTGDQEANTSDPYPANKGSTKDPVENQESNWNDDFNAEDPELTIMVPTINSLSGFDPDGTFGGNTQSAAGEGEYGYQHGAEDASEKAENATAALLLSGGTENPMLGHDDYDHAIPPDEHARTSSTHLPAHGTILGPISEEGKGYGNPTGAAHITGSPPGSVTVKPATGLMVFYNQTLDPLPVSTLAAYGTVTAFPATGMGVNERNTTGDPTTENLPANKGTATLESVPGRAGYSSPLPTLEPAFATGTIQESSQNSNSGLESVPTVLTFRDSAITTQPDSGARTPPPSSTASPPTKTKKPESPVEMEPTPLVKTTDAPELLEPTLETTSVPVQVEPTEKEKKPSKSVSVKERPSPEDNIEELEKEEEEEKEKEEILEEELVREEREVRRIGGFGVFLAILAMIFTAHQMSENPDGIYASCCRLIITLVACGFKIVLMPFRSTVGGSRGYGHLPVSTIDYGYRDPYRPGVNNAGGSMELS